MSFVLAKLRLIIDSANPINLDVLNVILGNESTLTTTCWPINKRKLQLLVIESPCDEKNPVEEHLHALIDIFDCYKDGILTCFPPDTAILSRDLLVQFIRVSDRGFELPSALICKMAERDMAFIYEYIDVGTNCEKAIFI